MYLKRGKVPKLERPQAHRERIFGFCWPKTRSEVVSQGGRDLRRLKRKDRSPGILPDPHPLS